MDPASRAGNQNLARHQVEVANAATASCIPLMTAGALLAGDRCCGQMSNDSPRATDGPGPINVPFQVVEEEVARFHISVSG